MNTHSHDLRAAIAVACAAMVLGACAYTLPRDESAAEARKRLDQLYAVPQLALKAPAAVQEAESAVRMAEARQTDRDEALHLVAIANRKVDTAITLAQVGELEDLMKLRGEQRDSARLASRTREADLARADAIWARNDADQARSNAELARSDADQARSDADQARSDADRARYEADQARDQTAEMQRQIAELNARQTERGLVVALGDVLFESGRSNLRSGATNNLDKLAAFLVRYSDRSVAIEGHTDDVGSDSYNQDLSQRRADAVKSYLIGQGVQASRLSSSGMGEGSPIAGNGSIDGRQLNRRVEVIIANPVVTASR